MVVFLLPITKLGVALAVSKQLCPYLVGQGGVRTGPAAAEGQEGGGGEDQRDREEVRIFSLPGTGTPRGC